MHHDVDNDVISCWMERFYKRWNCSQIFQCSPRGMILSGAKYKLNLSISKQKVRSWNSTFLVSTYNLKLLIWNSNLKDEPRWIFWQAVNNDNFYGLWTEQVWQWYPTASPANDCVTRSPLLYFIRSWVALSFKVCESVSQASVTPDQMSTLPLCAIYKGINALYWHSIIDYQLLPPHSVLHCSSTELHHLVTRSWANWI